MGLASCSRGGTSPEVQKPDHHHNDTKRGRAPRWGPPSPWQLSHHCKEVMMRMIMVVLKVKRFLFFLFLAIYFPPRGLPLFPSKRRSMETLLSPSYRTHPRSLPPPLLVPFRKGLQPRGKHEERNRFTRTHACLTRAPKEKKKQKEDERGAWVLTL